MAFVALDIAMIFACVVMYDAFGVRLHAGRQTEVLIQNLYELPAEHSFVHTRPLWELLGHTPTQTLIVTPDGGRTTLWMHVECQPLVEAELLN